MGIRCWKLYFYYLFCMLFVWNILYILLIYIKDGFIENWYNYLFNYLFFVFENLIVIWYILKISLGFVYDYIIYFEKFRKVLKCRVNCLFNFIKYYFCS